MTLSSMRSQGSSNGIHRNKLDEYRIIAKVGEGTYGHVFKAEHKESKKLVALKRLVKFANEEDGLPFTSIREIKFLQQMKSEKNVITLLDAFFSLDNELVCVFEWMEHDLSGLISSRKAPFTIGQIKCYMKQLVDALFMIHQRGLMHRDIKAANMLLNNSGGLFLADFGLMTSYTGRNKFTNNVITRWYKPPEILLGASNYGPAVDMWGVGCVLVEMLTGKTPFPGSNEAHQLDLIVKGCGSEEFYAAEEQGAQITKLHLFPSAMNRIRAKFPNSRKSNLRAMFQQHKFPEEVMSLLERLLTVDPALRITAEEVLDHDFFWHGEPPLPESEMPVYPSIHEYELKQMRSSNGNSNVKKGHYVVDLPGSSARVV